MTRTFTLIIALFISGIAFGQKTDSALLKQSDIYYFKNNGRLVPVRDSADYVRVISPPDSSDRNLFIVRDFYMNGRPRLVGKSIIPNYYLKRQGTFIEYFQNGHRRSIINYEKGDVTGDETWYYPNGKLYYISHYDKDKRNKIVSEARDSTGKVLADSGKGNWIVYDRDFKKITGQGPINNGVEDGEWKGIAFDSVKYVCLYKDGKATAGTSYMPSGKVIQFTQGEIEPVPIGGMGKFYEYIGRNVHYPKVAKQNGVQGKVFVTFVIEKDGRLVDARILRGIGSGCDEEAIKVIRAAAPWNPGYQFGVPVRVQYTVPLSFKLQRDNY